MKTPEEIFADVGIKNERFRGWRAYSLGMLNNAQKKNDLPDTLRDLKRFEEDAIFFEVTEPVKFLLINTKQKLNFPLMMPFNYLWIEVNFPYKDEWVLGIAVITIKGGKKLIVYEHAKGENIGSQSIPLEYTKKYKEIYQFLFSFLNFINTDEIRYAINVKPKSYHERREREGKPKMPSKQADIILSGYLKKYLSKVEEGNYSKISHRFIVKGHFMSFRNKRYKNIYERFCNNELKNEDGKIYQMNDKGILKRWILPYVKGEGILIKKNYILK